MRAEELMLVFLDEAARAGIASIILAGRLSGRQCTKQVGHEDEQISGATSS